MQPPLRVNINEQLKQPSRELLILSRDSIRPFVYIHIVLFQRPHFIMFTSSDIGILAAVGCFSWYQWVCDVYLNFVISSLQKGIRLHCFSVAIYFKYIDYEVLKKEPGRLVPSFQQVFIFSSLPSFRLFPFHLPLKGKKRPQQVLWCCGYPRLAVIAYLRRPSCSSASLL